MSRNRKSRAKNSQNSNNGNGHRPSNNTVTTVRNGTSTKTRNSVENFNTIVDADELEDIEEDEEYDQEEKTSRTRKIWLAVMAAIVLAALIGTAVNNLKQYQVKSIPTATPSESPSTDTDQKLATQLAKSESTDTEIESTNPEKDSYFELAQSGYNKVIADYVSSNGFRHYTSALTQQSKGKSAHRLLLQKLSTAIKQHEMLIGKNEAMAVSNPDSMKLLGTSLDILSMLNALQRLCQSANTCDGTQNFNDFTVPSADALVNLRLYQNEEITSLTQSQEFQIRKQIIEEEAKLPKSVKPNEKAKPAASKTDNNNSGLQRAN